MTTQLIPNYAGFRGGPLSNAYNEAAFKYFLDADRRRVERAERSIILVLVSIRRDPGRNSPLTDAIAARLFDGLAASVREVDFVGWYREGRIAGAVLPQAVGPSSELREVIAKRVLISLKRVVPADCAACLHVRVVRVGGKEQR
jgi:hypothetical protein